MNSHISSAITARLDMAQSSGQVSEYLISWVGSNGTLSPRVTVWCEAHRIAATKDRIEALLTGLVVQSDIEILAD